MALRLFVPCKVVKRRLSPSRNQDMLSMEVKAFRIRANGNPADFAQFGCFGFDLCGCLAELTKFTLLSWFEIAILFCQISLN